MLFLIVCFLCASVTAWEQVKREIRLPGELRVVNEGITHDDKNWYMSNQHILYKTTVDPIEIVLANYHAIPDELIELKYNHIGDLDLLDGILYAGLEPGSGMVLIYILRVCVCCRHHWTRLYLT